MTHHQLVEEWKTKFFAQFPDIADRNDKNYIIVFLKEMALAAAKRAAEAGKVEESKLDPEFLRRLTENSPDVVEATESESDGWNAAIYQSERQLTDYFREV
jgi:hypothetical protein